jgi:hypothetical protein
VVKSTGDEEDAEDNDEDGDEDRRVVDAAVDGVRCSCAANHSNNKSRTLAFIAAV